MSDWYRVTRPPPPTGNAADAGTRGMEARACARNQIGGYAVLAGQGVTGFVRQGRAWILTTIIVIAFCMASYWFFDRPLALYLRTIGPGLHDVFVMVNRLGVSTPYLVLSAAAFLVLRYVWRRQRGALIALFLFLALVLSGIIDVALKAVLGRARPKLLFNDHIYGFKFLQTQADWVSFPSGHATTVAALGLALILVWPRTRLVVGLLALAVILGRVIVDAHFLSDAVAGAFLGIASTVFLREVFSASGFDPATLLCTAATASVPR